MVGAAVVGLFLGAAVAFGLAGPGGSAEIHLAGQGSAGGPTPSAPGVSSRAPGAATGPLASQFSISGKVTGLYPGKSFPLVLTLNNPQTFAIVVTSITTAVQGASVKCVAGNVKVTAFSGSLAVGAKKTAKTKVTVTMLHSAPNACQGARFPLTYTGLGRRG